MADPVALAKYLLRAIWQRPEEVQVEYIWTPSADLVFLKLAGGAKRRLKQEDLAALVRVVERLGATDERQLVVDVR